MSSMSSKLRTALKIVHAQEQAEGVGARVRRSIGTMSMRNFNPFLMLDDFSISGDAGFPHHPHRGQETITLVLLGAVAHEDFTGSKGILYPGDLQFMTAGKGVVHSEMPVLLEGDDRVSGMQLWVDLPEQLRDVKPRYRDLRSYEIPETTQDDGKVKVKVILGNSYGVESLHDLAYTPVEYYYVNISPGGKFEQKLDPAKNFFMYVLKGHQLSANDNKVGQHHTIFFNRDGDKLEVNNPAGGDAAEFVVIGGEVLDQKSVQYGPFVAGSQGKIQEAFMDYQYGKNGFENIKTWNSLISDGVKKEMIPELGGGEEVRRDFEAKYMAKCDAEAAAEAKAKAEAKAGAKGTAQPVKDEL